mgnify:CR=1 FL=1
MLGHLFQHYLIQIAFPLTFIQIVSPLTRVTSRRDMAVIHDKIAHETFISQGLTLGGAKKQEVHINYKTIQKKDFRVTYDPNRVSKSKYI